MLFISVLLSLPCWAVSFLSPETMAYSLESPVPRMSQGRPRGCWLGPRLCNVSAFEYAIYVGHNFSSKEQASFISGLSRVLCPVF